MYVKRKSSVFPCWWNWIWILHERHNEANSETKDQKPHESLNTTLTIQVEKNTSTDILTWNDLFPVLRFCKSFRCLYMAWITSGVSTLSASYKIEWVRIWEEMMQNRISMGMMYYAFPEIEFIVLCRFVYFSFYLSWKVCVQPIHIFSKWRMSWNDHWSSISLFIKSEKILFNHILWM